MKTFIAIFSISVLSLFFVACQKEVDGDIDTFIESADSTFITRSISLDTTLPVGADTIRKSFFTYDNSKRLSKVLTYNVGTIDTFVYDFKYAGTDTLPNLMIEKNINYNGPGTTAVDSTFYTYNNAVIIKDSSVQHVFPGNAFDAALVHSFTTSGAVVKDYIKEYIYIGPILTVVNFDSAFYTVTTASVNISSQTKVDGGVAFYNTIQAGYDNKINPYKKIMKFRYPCFENLPFNSWINQSNNPLQVQYDQFFITDNLLYTYKYRVDGYPVSSTCFSNNGNSDYNKMLYVYTTL